MLPEFSQILTLEDAPAYWFLGALHFVVATNESTAGAYSLIHLTASSSFETPYHLHHTEDEAFYVLDGEITVICGGKKTVVGEGGYIFLPRGIAHGFRTSYHKDSHLLIHVIPGGSIGFMGMMLEMATPASKDAVPKPEPPDLPRLRVLCAKNKIEILGPLPE